jgi:hypothetical protein
MTFNYGVVFAKPMDASGAWVYKFPGTCPNITVYGSNPLTLINGKLANIPAGLYIISVMVNFSITRNPNNSCVEMVLYSTPGADATIFSLINGQGNTQSISTMSGTMISRLSPSSEFYLVVSSGTTGTSSGMLAANETPTYIITIAPLH